MPFNLVLIVLAILFGYMLRATQSKTRSDKFEQFFMQFSAASWERKDKVLGRLCPNVPRCLRFRLAEAVDIFLTSDLDDAIKMLDTEE